jgi:hypothetical protein
MRYHDLHLKLNGRNDWELRRIGTDEDQMGLEQEIRAIEESLRDVERWKTRLEEVKGELGSKKVAAA